MRSAHHRSDAPPALGLCCVAALLAGCVPLARLDERGDAGRPAADASLDAAGVDAVADPIVDGATDDGSLMLVDAKVDPLRVDTGVPAVVPNPDAFWAADPPTSECREDGSTVVVGEPAGGTPDCPADKNREGCRCSDVGRSASCWPGLRVDRNRGACRDGMTTCMPYDAFSGVWGPCVGLTLPVAGATTRTDGCDCFSTGRWSIPNIQPCFVDYGPGRGVYAVSTYVAGGSAACPTLPPSASPPPEPMPGTAWSEDSLTVDCAGRFELCYALRAGSVDMPMPTDCMLARVCTGDIWYPEPGVSMRLPDLRSWSSVDSACATRFRDSGGYGEMSVTGLSLDCEAIDDGGGGEYVFNRVKYCPIRCNTDPTGPGCDGCMRGSDGTF